MRRPMWLVLAAFALGLNGACARRVKLAWTDSVILDHDQPLVCGYIQRRDVIICMSPEEAEVRYNAAPLKGESDGGPE
jgi:hypothetical protein